MVIYEMCVKTYILIKYVQYIRRVADAKGASDR